MLPKFLTDILKIVVALVPFLIEAEFSGAAGTEKKAQVLKSINQVIDEPGGIDLPTWVAGEFRTWLLSIIVDVLVRTLNSRGFFAKSSG